MTASSLPDSWHRFIVTYVRCCNVFGAQTLAGAGNRVSEMVRRSLAEAKITPQGFAKIGIASEAIDCDAFRAAGIAAKEQFSGIRIAPPPRVEPFVPKLPKIETQGFRSLDEVVTDRVNDLRRSPKAAFGTPLIGNAVDRPVVDYPIHEEEGSGQGLTPFLTPQRPGTP